MNKKAIIAMSGGVDSSVAALIMQEKNYEIIGATLRLYDNKDIGLSNNNTCCSLSDVEDARRVAYKLGIPYYVFNFINKFHENVINRFVQGYCAGNTPNPCIDCNRYIKFDALLKRAQEINFDHVATGHYARIEYVGDRYLLKKGIDNTKDQSYVLYNLNQEQLNHVMFPLGDYDKVQVRELAKEFKLPVFNKKDSQDICFIPDNDYHRFLNSFFHEKSGDIINTKGQILGKHHGISHYTIGQRKGLGIAAATPLYVSEIDAGKNVVILADAEESLRDGMIVTEAIFSDGLPLKAKRAVKVKIRYNAKPVDAFIEPDIVEGQVKVTLELPLRGIAPGQAAVFYENDYCIGGGTILNSLKSS